MIVNKEDLQLSQHYKKAVDKANKIANSRDTLKKIHYRNRIEANIFLKDRLLIKKMLYKCSNKYDALYYYLQRNFNLTDKEIRLILLKNLYLNSKVKSIIISFILTLIITFVVYFFKTFQPMDSFFDFVVGIIALLFYIFFIFSLFQVYKPIYIYL